MAKFRFNLREASSESETAIHLIVRWNRNKLVFPTGLEIKPKFWETDKEKDNFQRAKRIKQFPTYPEFNTRLDNIESIAKNAFRRYVNDKNHEPTVEVFRGILNRDLNKKVSAELDLFGFIEQYIEEAKIKTNAHTGRTFSKNTIKLYKNSFNHLKDYSTAQRKKLSFENIDLDFYQDFIEYLTLTKRLATNTIGGIIKDLKTFLNEASERGINKNFAYKSKRFRVIAEESDSIYLTDEELNELFELDLSGGPRLEKVRDLFLVGCYTGLRYSDFTEIRQENIINGFIHITTKKTSEKVVIPFHPIVKAIFKKYRGHFPESISNQKLNAYLKEIAKMCESMHTKVSIKTTKGGVSVIKNYKKFELISSHTARRSFATNAYLQGVPSFVIMGITGHRTEKAFNKYIKITSSEKAKILQMHWQQNSMKVVS